MSIFADEGYGLRSFLQQLSQHNLRIGGERENFLNVVA